MDRFIIKEPQVISDNQTHDQDHAIDINVDNDPIDPAIDSNVDNDPIDDQTGSENHVEAQEALIGNTNEQANNDSGNFNNSPVPDGDDSFQPDIFDPRYWDSLDPKQLAILAQKALKETCYFKKVQRIGFQEGFLHYTILEIFLMESIVIGIGLSILRNLIEYFASVANYLQKGIEKVSSQLMGIMIGYIFVVDLKSMRQSDKRRSCFEYDHLV
jgi:hypothetical protein